MPGGDRTGPMGAGPMTGRRAGYCAGFNFPGYANPAPRLGLMHGFRGGGHGWRHRCYASGAPVWAPPTPEQETASLKAQAERLKAQLDVIQKRLEDLASKSPE